MEESKYQEIEIDNIVIPEERARATFTPEQEQELKASIEKNGFYIPILVKKIGDEKYELIDGEHRIKIVKEMGWKKIPAIVTEVDNLKATLLNFLANTARGTQNPIDISESLNRAKDAGLSEEELAAACGHTKEWVRFYLKLKDLPEPYRTALKEQKLSVGVVKEALRLPTPEEVDYFLSQQLVHNWPVGVVKKLIDNRIEELESIKKRADMMGEEIEPEKPDYENLAEYDECMICKRMVPRGHVWMKQICDDCLQLLDYIISQIGDPKKAMNEVYKALEEKKEREEYERLKAKFESKMSRFEEQPKQNQQSPLPSPTEKKPPFPTSSEEI